MATTKNGFGFITIEDGVLIATVEGVTMFRRKAGRKSALALGRYLAEYGSAVTEHWYYSSSIDFPHENGGPRINFRAAIAKGEGQAEVFDPINGGQRP